MYTVMHIQLNSKVIREKQEGDRIITVESIRDSIIKMNNHESDAVRSIINFQERTFPKIIYAQPYKDKIKIFSLGDNARIVLSTIFANLMQKGEIRIKDKFYKVVGVPRITTEVDALPYSDGSEFTYTTLTPLAIFNRTNQKVFQAIAGRHFKENHYFEKGTKEEMAAFKADLQVFVNDEIRDSLKYYLSNVIPNKKPEDFEFVDNVVIKWNNFNIIHERYHTEERKLPMVVGEFTCNFSLPRFLGFKVGKGFGELSLKKKSGGSLI